MQKGFTLIEVLLVILIIGTLAAAGFSGIIGFSEGANARLTKNRIINLINKARSRALNGREVDWTTCIDTSTNPQNLPEKKVPEFYGIKLSQNHQTIEFFARNKNADCTIEIPDFFVENQLKFKIKYDNVEQTAETDTILLYSLPFGQFSVNDNPTINNKIEFEIYNNSDKFLHSFRINKNIGIPE